MKDFPNLEPIAHRHEELTGREHQVAKEQNIERGEGGLNRRE